VHLLRYVFKYTVTDWSFNTKASCLKCPPSAWIHFLTLVTRDLITLRSTSALLIFLAVLRIRWSSSSLSCSPCGHTQQLSCNPTHGNLMGSDPVTVMANSAYRHDQSISLGIYETVLSDDLTEMRRRSVMLVVYLSSCL